LFFLAGAAAAFSAAPAGGCFSAPSDGQAGDGGQGHRADEDATGAMRGAVHGAQNE
jgi:hypothetical protein